MQHVIASLKILRVTKSSMYIDHLCKLIILQLLNNEKILREVHLSFSVWWHNGHKKSSESIWLRTPSSPLCTQWICDCESRVWVSQGLFKAGNEFSGSYVLFIYFYTIYDLFDL